MAPGNDSPTGNDPVPSPEPARGSKLITCEACESTLHSSGDVKKKSDWLKKLEKNEDGNEAFQKRIDDLEAANKELREQLAKKNDPPTPVDAPPSNDPPRKTRKGLVVYSE
jgi:hypothetical protein